MYGPPAYLATADVETVRFVAPDESWRVQMSRAKWSELGRPEVLYGITGEMPTQGAA
jgi:hypothetical protein